MASTYLALTVGFIGGSLVAQVVKKNSCNAGDWGPSLGLEDPLEKGMATHSDILAWRIPWTGEPDALQSVGSQRWDTPGRLTLSALCRHFWASQVAQWTRIRLLAGDMGFDPWVGKFPWRRKWQPIPVFLAGKFHGQRSLVGYSPWSCGELDTTEHTCKHLGFIWFSSGISLVAQMVKNLPAVQETQV